MTPIAELIKLLGQWRELTKREGQAMAQNNWTVVAKQQARKQQLTSEISQAACLVRASHVGAPMLAAAEKKEIDSIVAELIAMETGNRDLVRSKREKTRAELDGLHQSSRVLGGIRQAYGGTPGHRWQSYS
jgi:hypothetical protein